jgi:hypothetical protein
MSDVAITMWSRVRGAGLLFWIVVCDILTKCTARLGGCPDEPLINAAFFEGMLSAPNGCEGTELAGPALRLVPGLHDGALFGLGAGQFGGFLGQVYALGLLFFAVSLTIIIRRWKYQTGADSRVLALVWAGVLMSSIPRLAGTGLGWYELDAFGLLTGIGELSLVLGVLWALWRFVAEFIG